MALQKAQQGVLVTEFKGDHGQLLRVAYHGSHQSFRIHLEDRCRLFFFQPDFFDKIHFTNEYGVLLGQLRFRAIYEGTVQIDATKYIFKLAGEDPQVTLYEAGTDVPLLSFEITDELLIEEKGDPQQNPLINCLLFTFCWLLQHPGVSS